MHKIDFLTVLDEAISKNNGIAVFVQLPDLPEFEIITNPAANVSLKKNYYDAAYDDVMRLKNNPLIRILKVELV